MNQEQPIGWRMSAIRCGLSSDPSKKRVMAEDFKTKEEADCRKLSLQTQGFIATVVPVFIRPATRNRRMVKNQAAPLGDFRAGWKLCR